MTPPKWQTNFIAALNALERDDDRGTLAKLRRGLGKEFGLAPQRDGWVLVHLPPSLNDFQVDNACLIASLFARHSEPGGQGTLGAAFCRLADAAAGADSVERRFHVLLESDSEDLPDRLRHAVSLLKSKDIAINWLQLLGDVLWWNTERHHVQRRWSRDFWAPDTPPTQEAVAATAEE